MLAGKEIPVLKETPLTGQHKKCAFQGERWMCESTTSVEVIA